MSVETKGSSIRSIGAYVQTLDPEFIRRVEANLSPDECRLMYEAKPDDWYPHDYFAAPYRAIVAAHDDPVAGRRAVEAAGRWACEEMANSFLRLVMRMMTPGLFVKKCSQLLAKDFRGWRGGAPDVIYDLSKEKAGEVTIEVRNIGNHPYLGASAIGYIEFAFEHMGKKNLKVEERDCDINDYAAPFARWYVTWTP